MLCTLIYGRCSVSPNMLLSLIVSLTTCLYNVEALTCLVCRDIHQPRQCHNVEDCSGNDMFCLTEQVQNSHGQAVFNLGCAASDVCNNGTHSACHECCSRDLCNAEGCGQPGFPADRGLVCFACPETLEIIECKDIQYCQPNEICRFTSRLEFGRELATRGCVPKDVCDADPTLPIIGKRSSSADIVSPQCDMCCSQDLCNQHCTVPSTTTSTTMATTTPPLQSDCYDLMHVSGVTISGVYDVMLTSGQTVSVYCDMETSGGGWTVFQNRESVEVDFYRNMSDYVNGFGNLSGNFWLGLETVYEMTSNLNNTLYIKLEDANGTHFHEYYDNFGLSGAPNYTLHVGLRHGPPSNYSMNYHDGCRFYTYDDDTVQIVCAYSYHGAWWYNTCYQVNLNGQYFPPGTKYGTGMIHNAFHIVNSLKRSRIMFRRQ